MFAGFDLPKKGRFFHIPRLLLFLFELVLGLFEILGDFHVPLSEVLYLPVLLAFDVIDRQHFLPVVAIQLNLQLLHRLLLLVELPLQLVKIVLKKNLPLGLDVDHLLPKFSLQGGCALHLCDLSVVIRRSCGALFGQFFDLLFETVVLFDEFLVVSGQLLVLFLYKVQLILQIPQSIQRLLVHSIFLERFVQLLDSLVGSHQIFLVILGYLLRLQYQSLELFFLTSEFDDFVLQIGQFQFVAGIDFLQPLPLEHFFLKFLPDLRKLQYFPTIIFIGLADGSVLNSLFLALVDRDVAAALERGLFCLVVLFLFGQLWFSESGWAGRKAFIFGRYCLLVLVGTDICLSGFVAVELVASVLLVALLRNIPNAGPVHPNKLNYQQKLSNFH